MRHDDDNILSKKYWSKPRPWFWVLVFLAVMGLLHLLAGNY
jgi:hypothetical protein